MGETLLWVLPLVPTVTACAMLGCLSLLSQRPFRLGPVTVGDPRRATNRAWIGAFSITLLSAAMPDPFGLPVLVLSMHNDEPYVIEALRAGAMAYILKGSESAEIVAQTPALPPPVSAEPFNHVS